MPVHQVKPVVRTVNSPASTRREYMLEVKGSTDSLLPALVNTEQCHHKWVLTSPGLTDGRLTACRTEDLRGGGSGHGCEEEGVAHAVLQDLGAQGLPVPHARQLRGLEAPQVELELALGEGGRR